MRDESADAVSVFDILKIGIGPSSSHTLGPWRAAEQFVDGLRRDGRLDRVARVRVELFGSLAKTGRGHGTGIALMMGLCGHDPVTCDTAEVQRLGPEVLDSGRLLVGGVRSVPFSREHDLVFDGAVTLAGHPNGMRFVATLDDGATVEQVSYSLGGGFVAHESSDEATGGPSGPSRTQPVVELPYPIGSAADVITWGAETGTIAELVRRNERVWRTDAEIDAGLLRIRDVMRDCAFRGVSTTGTLPGGLDVARRAHGLHESLMGPVRAADSDEWFEGVRHADLGFGDTVRFVSCLALAVNEENAAFGRVVTAPTNGAAGVIPAVLFHHLAQLDHERWSSSDIDELSVSFLLVAAEIGSIFKKRATISAAMGGCQAEIGVSSAMAAAALTECHGGTIGQSLMAAEIAMEHHLGMTCDPIGGLVQIPCIERNAMGAIKAISAAHLALTGEPALARVTLDDVIDTMWATAQDMSEKYKETAEGGLARRIAVSVVEC
ncbi:L-serine ammonia-lyase [Ilumatobacter sp.]|uniref:L-serine ammonia-lyase n=1 Tax=Ilumatobacter sp. TaxID=1967498 RepID=UPI003C44D82B